MTAALAKLVESKGFQNTILAVIVAASVLVGIQTYEFSSPAIANLMPLLDIIDKIILWIFVAEVVVKMGAEGSKPWRYFFDPWNVFDFIIVAVCLLIFEWEKRSSGGLEMCVLNYVAFL